MYTSYYTNYDLCILCDLHLLFKIAESLSIFFNKFIIIKNLKTIGVRTFLK